MTSSLHILRKQVDTRAAPYWAGTSRGWTCKTVSLKHTRTCFFSAVCAYVYVYRREVNTKARLGLSTCRTKKTRSIIVDVKKRKKQANEEADGTENRVKESIYHGTRKLETLARIHQPGGRWFGERKNRRLCSGSPRKINIRR